MALWCSQTRRSTACQFGEQRLAKLRPSLTAILGYEEHQAFERVDFGTLDELAPALFGFDEPCLGQGGKVGRKCALRQARSLDESAGGKSLDRKSVVSGKSVPVRVDLGGRRTIKKKSNLQHLTHNK